MDEIEKGLREFLDYWFSGLMHGLEELDEPSRRKVLDSCGRACAQSHTVQVFCEAKQASTDMDSFLQNLASRFPSAQYVQDGPNTIRVIYRQCGCDLIRLGLVKSPWYCECTEANLRENFQQALGVPVHVTLETSILRGGTYCALTVSLNQEF